MKKTTWIGMLLALTLLLCACASPAAAEPSSEPIETADAAAETAEVTPEPVDYQALYRPTLDQICAFLTQTEADDAPVPDGMTGLGELRMALEPGDILNQIGYQIADLSGDGVPELLIGVLSYQALEGRILAIYSVDESGTVVQPVEGWMRNRYYLLDDGGLYNEGSNGAAYSIFADYALSADGTALECRDYYFTYEKTDGDYADIGCYHNTTGVYDRDQAELMDIEMEAFWEISNDYVEHITPMELAPLSALPAEG